MNMQKLQSVKFFYPLIISLLVWFVCYHMTLYSMVYTWWHLETFTHGFLIFPISLYLIWDKRQLFYSVEKSGSIIFLLLLLILVFIWILGDIVDVNLVKQTSVVMMLPVIVGVFYGFNVLKLYLFPFLYLLFAIPFGEFLVPELQNLTAAITVLGLQWTGIPVYTEGLYISIPSGDFEVAVACSGIRYLIASLALGTLYAYITYQKSYKRVLFILASFILPLVANGIRAYGIVLIAHLSDMKYATGVDHLIYGWLFFGLVIFILFWLGSYFSDEDVGKTNIVTKPSELKVNINSSLLAGVLLIMILGPLSGVWSHYETKVPDDIVLIEPQCSQEWTPSVFDYRGEPNFIGVDRELKTAYKDKNNNKINLYIALYLSEGQNKELINYNNYFFNIKKWRMIERNVGTIDPGSADIHYDEYQLSKNEQNTLVFGWYYIMGYSERHPVKVKILQGIGKLTGIAREGAYVSIAMNYTGDKAQARQIMADFIKQNSTAIYQSIHNVKVLDID